MESLQKAPFLNVWIAGLPGHSVIFLIFRQNELRHTRLDVRWSEKAEMLTDFSARLRYSGSERYIQQVIESVLANVPARSCPQHQGAKRVQEITNC